MTAPGFAAVRYYDLQVYVPQYVAEALPQWSPRPGRLRLCLLGGAGEGVRVKRYLLL